MRLACISSALLTVFPAVKALPSLQVPHGRNDDTNSTIPTGLFTELEELARIVDISYCVGSAGLGIQKPFQCLSRCSDFPSFELVKTFHTGLLLSDSCGYIALSHPPAPPRVIVAFRGTYSIVNTVADLSTKPQEYVPYPGVGDTEKNRDASSYECLVNRRRDAKNGTSPSAPKCNNCTVHSGFHTSWLNTRAVILPILEEVLPKYPDYTLTLVGHSLGGAVAALASLDLMARGWDPHVTTFGEPRIGNAALNHYLDARFGLSPNGSQPSDSKYRRVTHVDDPVPLLPLEEWDYRMHAGELFISKSGLPPVAEDIRRCAGDEDQNCIAGSNDSHTKDTSHGPLSEALRELQALVTQHLSGAQAGVSFDEVSTKDVSDAHWGTEQFTLWPGSSRFKLWQLFFAHRDYFWRLGLCIPGGDPWDWYRKYPHADADDQRVEL